MTLEETPEYKHDCDKSCVFLGRFKSRRYLSDKLYSCDLYLCCYVPKPPEPTVIARWGNDGPEYSSTLLSVYSFDKPGYMFSHPWFSEAIKRAIKRELFSDEWIEKLKGKVEDYTPKEREE